MMSKEQKIVLLIICFLLLVVTLYTIKSDTMNQFTLTSTAFQNNQPIPTQFACKGENISPPLAWQNAPANTKSFVLIVDDPDAPHGTWVHWVVYNLPATVTHLDQHSDIKKIGGIEGTTSFNNIGYGGPCPPSGTHRYFFKLYAVDTVLNLGRGANKEEVIHALQGHILGHTELIGLFSHA